MKKTIIAVLLLSFSATVLCQEITVARESLSDRNADIDTLTNIRGKLIRFQFDTLFYSNRIAVRDYIDTKNKNKKLSDLSKSLIDTMKVNINGIEEHFEALNQSITNNNQIIKKSVEDNNLRINELLNKNNMLTENNLQLTQKLKDANNQITAEKWKSFGTKLLYGTGGIVVGVGLSAIVVMVSK